MKETDRAFIFISLFAIALMVFTLVGQMGTISAKLDRIEQQLKRGDK